MAVDNNWLEVAGNMRKARKSWILMNRILGWGGAYLSIPGVLFKVFV